MASLEQTPPPHLSSNSLIGIVDDDSAFLRSLSRLLRSSGYAVVTFTSAGDCLNALPPLRPCCLIVDVHMPKMDGFGLLQALRKRGDLTPVLFVTGHESPAAHARAREGNSLGLFPKAFHENALLASIASAVQLGEDPRYSRPHGAPRSHGP